MKNLFKKKLKQSKQNFSELIGNAKRIYTFFPTDVFISHEILTHVYNWNQHFPELIFIVPDFNYKFFEIYGQTENLKFVNFADKFTIQAKSIIFNLNKNIRLEKLLNDKMNSIIVSINDNSNLIFAPKPKSEIEILRKFADFFNLTFEGRELNFEFSGISKPQFIQNKFPNFIIDIHNKISKKKLTTLVSTFKQDFSANIYLTKNNIGKNEFLNLKKVEIESLIDLLSYALNSDLFITDNASIAQIFSNKETNILFLGNQNLDDVKNVNIKDIFEIKSIINEIIKKENKR